MHCLGHKGSGLEDVKSNAKAEGKKIAQLLPGNIGETRLKGWEENLG